MAESSDATMMKLHVKTSKTRETIELAESATVDEVRKLYFEEYFCFFNCVSWILVCFLICVLNYIFKFNIGQALGLYVE